MSSLVLAPKLSKISDTFAEIADVFEMIIPFSRGIKSPVGANSISDPLVEGVVLSTVIKLEGESLHFYRKSVSSLLRDHSYFAGESKNVR